MDLYLLRHGKAGDPGPGGSDAERHLTKKGEGEILTIAHWMAAQDFRFDLVAASPFARAQETAAIVAGGLRFADRVETWEELVPGGNPDTVCRKIGGQKDAEAILLVGHEPLFSTLIGRIIAGNPDAGIVMTKGGLAKIRDFSFTRQPAGELHWLLTAKQMSLPE